MADRRIRVAKDKEEIISRLVAGGDSMGPFGTIAEAIAFAAALGASRSTRISLAELSKAFEPIRRSVFDARGLDTLINLLAVCSEKKPSILSRTDAAEDSRATAFEEYANGGFQILQHELRGAVDATEALVLILQAEAQRKPDGREEFDLAALIGK